MLMENKKCVQSNLGLNRKQPPNYRGMTDEEIEEIYKGQKDQIHELQVGDVHILRNAKI